MTFLYTKVRTCHTCQMTAALPPHPQKKLQPIPPPSKTWKHIGMDLICDFSKSKDGYKHILVSVCYLSNYVAVRPLKSETSEEVIQNLKDQHDQGREFTSSVSCVMIFLHSNQILSVTYC